MQDFVHQQYVAELRRFGLDKGADGQVVDARSLEFSKKKQSGFFSPTKRVICFPTGRDHIILPYLCEYHVISWCISPTLFLFVGSYGEVKVYHFFHSFSKEAYDSSLEKKTDLKSFRVQRRFLQFAGISEWYSWWFRNPQKPVEHG